ncbi:MAG: DUF1566 domain-containing protein [Candidatus Riflebacteria bacterium]|nr:DUF1566 domain-containing protein [Candidatus Riflebacteria bacterium]
MNSRLRQLALILFLFVVTSISAQNNPSKDESLSKAWVKTLLGKEELKVASSGNAQFIKNKSNVITDLKTGLQWYWHKADISWSEAKVWVRGLSVDGGGWRIPSIKELRTLHPNGYPSGFFPSSNVWSSEFKDPSNLWTFYIYHGYEEPLSSAYTTAEALAVRSLSK